MHWGRVACDNLICHSWSGMWVPVNGFCIWAALPFCFCAGSSAVTFMAPPEKQRVGAVCTFAVALRSCISR